MNTTHNDIQQALNTHNNQQVNENILIGIYLEMTMSFEATNIYTYYNFILLQVFKYLYGNKILKKKKNQEKQFIPAM